MRKCPSVYNVDEFRHWPCQVDIGDGHYELARPVGFRGLFLRHRLRLAWRVFKGEYDAVKWVQQ